MAKILFRNSDFRFYRTQFYDFLCKEHTVKFIFRFNPVPAKYDYISIKENRPSFWADKDFIKKYLKLLLLSDYNVYIAALPTHSITVIGLLISKFRGKKNIIWVERWLDPEKHGIKGIFKTKYHKFIYRLADAYFSTSTKSNEFLKRFVKTDEKNIYNTLQANIDMSIFQPKRPDIKLPNNSIIFLYFGRIIDWKGLDILIKAFSITHKTHNNIFLLIVGEGGFKEYCQNLTIELRLSNVLFHHQIDDNDYDLKRGIYNLCDVFVLPSTIVNGQTEGWGLTVGEAMSLSKPVIVTDAVGCSKDLVQDGVNGFVVKHGSVNALAAGMIKIIERKDSLSKMGQKSRNIFEEKISFYKMANTLSFAINNVYEK